MRFINFHWHSHADANLDDCGPIPFMEAKMRQPDEADPEAESDSQVARRNPGETKRWLYLTQIGEDSADCLSEANSASEAEKSYPFGEYIVVQCATYGENAADDDQ